MYYFAYGANIDVEQMKYRCPGASFIGVAILPGYDFYINSRGVATVLQDTFNEVYGLLWEVTEEDLDRLDKFEGVSKGLYKRNTITIEAASNQKVETFTYVATDETLGKPKAGYLENIIASAEQHQFPKEYVEKLNTWLLTDV